jgi:methyl-accepting chemotaxis protein
MLQDLKFSIHADQKTAAAFGKVKSDLGRLKGELRGLGGELQRTDGLAVSAADSLAHVGRSTGRLGSLSPAATNNLRNLSFQFNQIGQQGAATGNYLQALTIQIPDILAAFGSLPLVIAGGAAALGASLIPSLISGAEAAQSFDEAMGDLEGQLSTSSEVIDLISNDFNGLREKLAGSREEIALLGQSIAAVSLKELGNEADDLVRSLTKMYDGTWYNSRREDLRAAFMELGASVNELASDLDRLSRAGSLNEQLSAASHLRQHFLEMAGPVGDMTEAQFEFYSAMVDTEEALRTTLRAAEDNEDALSDAADAAASINDPFAAIISNILTATKAPTRWGTSCCRPPNSGRCRPKTAGISSWR